MKLPDEVTRTVEQIKSTVHYQLMAQERNYGTAQTDIIRLPIREFRLLQYLFDPRSADVFGRGPDGHGWRLFGVNCEPHYDDSKGVQLLKELVHLS
jgi:hypothetical protein